MRDFIRNVHSGASGGGPVGGMVNGMRNTKNPHDRAFWTPKGRHGHEICKVRYAIVP